MKTKIPQSLRDKLDKRKQSQRFRTLNTSRGSIDFSSNDYLGFSRSEEISEKAIEILGKMQLKNGATGSRLITGSYPLYKQVEDALSEFYDAPSVLLFNSGFQANLGFFASVPQKGDTVLYDEYIHASIRDGIRLSFASSFSFKHNDPDDIKKKLLKAKGNTYIVVESIYSMTGDMPDLAQLCTLCEERKCYLIVDEAHASGVFGTYGTGMVQHLGIGDKVFARIHPFGKAIGCCGAAISGPKELKEYLINYARSFIYTTAMPPYTLAAIRTAHQKLRTTVAIGKLKENINYFKLKIKEFKLDRYFIPGPGAIQCCIIGENQKALDIAARFRQQNFDIKAIRTPTVPEGKECLRFSIHSYNTKAQINTALELLSQWITL